MIFLGTIKEPKGLKGEFEIIDVPLGLTGLSEGSTLKIGYTANFAKEYKLKSWLKSGEKVFISLLDINSPEKALELKGLGIFVKKNLIKFEESSFEINDLIGCSIIDIENEDNIGILKDVYVLPANDVWIIETPEGELTIPVIKEVIKNVDIKNKTIKIKLIEGLLDLIDKKTNGKEKDTFAEN